MHRRMIFAIPADASIEEAVRLMKENSIGSLLVVSDVESDKLEPVGIFTERDLLKRIDLIQKGGFWEKPVRTVMSRPLLTLPLSRFHEAAETMMVNRIRHLPIVSDDGKNPELVAVISMRDLFERYVQAEKSGALKISLKKATEAPKTTHRILHLGANPVWQQYVQTVTQNHPDARFEVVKTWDPEAVMVIDWEGLSAPEQASVLENAEKKSRPGVFVLCSAFRVKPEDVQRMQKMEKQNSGFKIFHKPIPTFGFYTALKEAAGL